MRRLISSLLYLWQHKNTRLLCTFSALLLFSFLLLACLSQPTSTPLLLTSAERQSPTPIFSDTPPPFPLFTSSPLPSGTPSPTASPTSVPTLLLSNTPTPPSPFPLSLPVPIPDSVDPLFSIIDLTYRFASTQGGQRPVHHGVEFLLPFGSPVLAAADGVVFFAGDDNNRSPYSPPRRHAYFGNFIVLEHSASLLTDRGLGERAFYTLYAHLSQINVEAGDTVHAGDEIGLIGFSGAALGPHLHFEVRFNGFTYADSYNPELFVNFPGRGALVGRLLDANGHPIPPTSLTLTYLTPFEPVQGKPGTGIPVVSYLTTYEDPKLTFRPPYNENFGLSLPPGQYELAFVVHGIHTETFEIRPSEITILEIIVGDE